MAVVTMSQGGGLTEESYSEAVRKLTGKDKFASAADWPVEGLLVHTAGPAPDGWRVVDVWESQEAFEAFGAHLGPVLEELGITEPPQVYPAHTYVNG